MAKKFAELRARISPERRARIDEAVNKAMEKMPLNELREALIKSNGDLISATYPRLRTAGSRTLEGTADFLI